MPKPKLQRAVTFQPGTKPIVDLTDFDGLPTRADVPRNLSTSQVNQLYETGIEGFPDEYIPSAEERRIEELEEQLEQMMQGHTNELAVQDGSLMVHGFQFTKTGLIAPDNMDQDTWEKVGQLLFRLEGSIQWLIGDWIVYGGQVGWGDLPELAEKLGRDYQGLRDISYVSRNVQLSLRSDKLSFAHHRLVAPLTLEQQVYSLEYAAESKLSVNAFRKWIDEQKGKTLNAKPALPSSDFPSLKALSDDFDKLAQRDPSMAKPADHKKARQVYAEAQQAIRDFGRKWGIE